MNEKRFVEEICQMLQIEVPEIKRDLKKKTIGNFAVLEHNDGKNIIHIDNECDDELLIYLSIAHELRHVYQVAYDPDILNCAVPLGTSSRAYNLQPSEIDANAFALIVMANYFGVRPLFEGYEEDIKKLIEERAKIIVKNLIIK